jgi:hypothetical protein
MENNVDAMYENNKDTSGSTSRRLLADARRVASPIDRRGTEPRNPNFLPPVFAGNQTEEQLRVERERLLQIRRTETRLAFIMAMAHGAVELSLKNQKPNVRRPVLGDLKKRYGLRTNMRV